VRLTYLSALSIAPNGQPAPFADGRPLGSALYFMVTPRAPVRLHRIRNDQLYHYYLGDPIELFLLQANGSAECIVVGPDLRNGERVQQFIPGNTFQTAHHRPAALVSRRQYRMAGRRPGRRRHRQSRRARRQISGRGRRAARHCSVGDSYPPSPRAPSRFARSRLRLLC
jgi:hypothetical protein